MKTDIWLPMKSEAELNYKIIWFSLLGTGLFLVYMIGLGYSGEALWLTVIYIIPCNLAALYTTRSASSIEPKRKNLIWATTNLGPMFKGQGSILANQAFRELFINHNRPKAELLLHLGIVVYYCGWLFIIPNLVNFAATLGRDIFMGLIDSTDSRAFDPNAETEALDALATLRRQGNVAEAQTLARQLAKKGIIGNSTAELFQRCATEEKLLIVAPPITGNLAPAEKPPGPKRENLPANWREPVDRLLAEHRFGSAVELLQQQAEAQPANFELWLRLAEIQGRHCRNLATAEKIIRRMEGSGRFPPEQIQEAKTQWQQWRDQHPDAKSGW